MGSEFTFVQLEASVLWTGRREGRGFVLLCTPSHITQKHNQGVLETPSSFLGNSIKPTASPSAPLAAPASKGSWQIWVSCSTSLGMLTFQKQSSCIEETVGTIKHINVGDKYVQGPLCCCCPSIPCLSP